MSIQLFGNNIRISQESSIAVRFNSDNIELWKHYNFCMCVTEVWSQGQVHAGHVLYLLLVPPPPSLLIIFEIESPRLVLRSLCISGRVLIYDPTASASTVAGNSCLCFTVPPPEWSRNEDSGRSFPGHSRGSLLWSVLDQGALGRAKKDCFLCARCWLYAAPVVKLRHRQPEDISSFLFINPEPLFFSAWHVLLSFRWGNAKARQDCHSLSHCPMATMLLNILSAHDAPRSQSKPRMIPPQYPH